MDRSASIDEHGTYRLQGPAWAITVHPRGRYYEMGGVYGAMTDAGCERVRAECDRILAGEAEPIPWAYSLPVMRDPRDRVYVQL